MPVTATSAERYWLLALLLACAPAAADEAADAAPDLALLEYLGSWDESDEEWMLFGDEVARAEEIDTGDDDDRDATSRETEHES